MNDVLDLLSFFLLMLLLMWLLGFGLTVFGGSESESIRPDNAGPGTTSGQTPDVSRCCKRARVQSGRIRVGSYRLNAQSGPRCRGRR